MQHVNAFFLILLLLSATSVFGQRQQRLPRSTPEAEGVSSEGILRFINAAEKSPVEFHSVMILRHGKVIAEGWWYPYAADLKHTMYSVSKSWTSTAVGFAVRERLISVDDPVIKFFPNDLPDTVTNNLRELNVRHLLTMSVGHDPDPTFNIVSDADNWVSAFLANEIANRPGSKFLYNTTATYMLSAIVQKVTGQKVMDYLRSRLFDPLGIYDFDSEIDPLGINTGGWGMRFRTEAMAKFGQLYLNKGKWNGKQILPAAWVDEATRAHIMQAPGALQAVRDSSDWLQGYGYQFWRTRHDAFRADGAYGQFIVVLPGKDMVIVFTAETPDMQRQINLAWEHLLPAVKDKALPSNSTAAVALKQKLMNLSLPVPEGMASSPVALDGRTVVLEANDFSIGSVTFRKKEQGLEVTFSTPFDHFVIPFAHGKWAFSETKKHGPYLVAGARAKFVGLPPFKVAGAYVWRDPNTLELTLRYIESPHTETLRFTFASDAVDLDVIHSLNPAHTDKIAGSWGVK